MRDYAKVAPQFWTGETGKKIRAAGAETVVVALYLMTCPHANMIGLYYLPKMYIAHETGLGMEGASKGLARAIEAGFCSYDEASEHVFVHAMARFQIADKLDPKDKRCKGIENELARAPKGLLLQGFMETYAVAFCIKNVSPFEAPSKPRAGTGAGTGAIPTTSGGEVPADPDPIFGHGLSFLVRKGIQEKGARSFLGAMRKEVRDDLVVTELLIEAERQDVSDPLAWLRAAGRKRIAPPASAVPARKLKELK